MVHLGGTKVCSLIVGGVLAVVAPTFSDPSPAANVSAQTETGADDQPGTNPADERKPSPRFQGSDLPVAPRQGHPWTPPATSLPLEVVDATRAVFDEGLADQTVSDLFSDEGAWSHVLRPDRSYDKNFGALCETPLVGLPGFRNELLRRLRDKEQVSVMEVSEESLGFPTSDGSNWGCGLDRKLPLVPPPGTHVPLRSCDFYSFYLGNLPGAPDFALYWPEAKRDEGVAQMIAYLEAYGDNLRYGPDQRDNSRDDLPVGGHPRLRSFWRVPLTGTRPGCLSRSSTIPRPRRTYTLTVPSLRWKVNADRGGCRMSQTG